MSKRRAILFFATLLLMVAGYVAWCARPLYVRPNYVLTGFKDGDPKKSLLEDYLILLDEPYTEFDWAVFRWCLENPWEWKPEPTHVYIDPWTEIDDESISRFFL